MVTSKTVASRLICSAIAALLLSPAAQLSAQSAAAPSYSWHNVHIVGGGYVDGIIAHPKERGLFYARTDVGGAYRYDSAKSTWIPLNDWTSPSDGNLMGIESIAIDPNNPNKLYMVAGEYLGSWASNGAVLVSSDQGRTFEVHPLKFRAGSNEQGRNVGERLQVDPNQSSVLFYGTFNDSSQPDTNGLWTSRDGGTSWAKVGGFKALSNDSTGAGVAFVAFYKPSGSKGNPTKTIFAGVSTSTAVSTLYASTDGGLTWNPVWGGPGKGLMPQRGQIGPDGSLYITYGDFVGPNKMTAGKVYKYDIGTGNWHDITPSDSSNYPHGFSGLSVDPARPGTAVVMTMDRYYPSDTMFRTTDGGKTWTDVGAKAVRDASASPWVTWGSDKAGFGNWGEVVLDPFDSAHAMYGTGATVWTTSDLTAVDNTDASKQVTHWTIGANGIEETVPLALISPTAGAHLISGLGDVCGFVHTSVSQAPIRQNNNPICKDTTGLDFAKNDPQKIVRVGDGGSAFGAVSSNGGATWTPFANQAGSTKGDGTVAMSADGGTIVWAPSDVAPAYSTNNGASWTSLANMLPTGVQVMSDGANTNLFYAWNKSTGTFYTSSNKGVTWYATTTKLPIPASYQSSQAVTVTGAQGEIWLTTPVGLYRSSNSGWSWQHVSPAVSSATSIGFGKAATGKYYSTIYVAGTVNGNNALFRSTDTGATWVQINDAQHQWGGIGQVVGDPRTFGRVYLDTSGRGVIYGKSSN